eukprot:8852901-Pyramimonas_sp.AAC.1
MRPTDAPCVTQRDEHAHVLSWGYTRAPFSSAHTGVQIRLRRDMFRIQQIAEVYSPPSAIQGRAGAVLLRSG